MRTNRVIIQQHSYTHTKQYTSHLNVRCFVLFTADLSVVDYFSYCFFFVLFHLALFSFAYINVIFRYFWQANNMQVNTHMLQTDDALTARHLHRSILHFSLNSQFCSYSSQFSIIFRKTTNNHLNISRLKAAKNMKFFK